MPTSAFGPVDPLSSSAMHALRETVHRLVWPGGCAWHAAQTHASLTPFLIEETAEFVDAIDRGLEPAEVVSELADLLYQVLFHAAIAERDGEGYDFEAVAETLDRKLIARHPHVFGDRGYLSVEELHAEWERLKEDAAGEQRGSRGPLAGIPAGMPTLARAAKVVERLKRADRCSPEQVAAIHPAADRVLCGRDGATADAEGTDPVQEIGDALLAIVGRANLAGIDPDRALRLATARLAERHVEE